MRRRIAAVPQAAVSAAGLCRQLPHARLQQ